MSRRHTSPAWAPPLENEDLLEEILLRLPPHPSSLPRASLVRKLWRSILSGPQFLRRFRKHHREPPLLGFFTGHIAAKPVFTPVLDSPDRIPPVCFSLPQCHRPCDQWLFMRCCHGLTIMINDYERKVLVWDPLTGQQHHMPYLLELGNAKRESFWVGHAAVLRADSEDGHVHDNCFLSPFKVILIHRGAQTFACLYESTSDVWGNIASTASTDTILPIRPNILIGNAVYWLFYAGDILAFDIERQTLDVIVKPANICHTDCWSFQLLRADDGSGLHLAVMSKLSIKFWKRKSSSNGVIGWVPLQKIIQLEGLLPHRLPRNHKRVVMVGYDEESNVIVLRILATLCFNLSRCGLEEFLKAEIAGVVTRSIIHTEISILQAR